MQNDLRAARPLILFFIIWAALWALFDTAIVALGFTRPLVTSIMWSVGFAAIAALKLSGRNLSELGWGWGPARYHVIAYALPIAYAAVTYLLAAQQGLIQFGGAEQRTAFTTALSMNSLGDPLGFFCALLLTITVGMVPSMSTALGEEIGWRGFLTPRMTALAGFLLGTLITGVIWASWHLPGVLLSDYNGGGDQRWEVASFVVMAVAISGPMAWLRLKSGSLWPAATLHAAHNLFVQNIFDTLTVRGSNHVTMVGEFGVVMAGVCVLASLPFWVMGARLARPASSPTV